MHSLIRDVNFNEARVSLKFSLFCDAQQIIKTVAGLSVYISNPLSKYIHKGLVSHEFELCVSRLDIELKLLATCLSSLAYSEPASSTNKASDNNSNS